MTDKQIIIDSIDVSGCEFYKGYCRIAALCDYSGHLCEVTSNCYYKQLKRKEQECEELKIYIESNEQQVKEVETLVMDNDSLINGLDQLKAELEQYKKSKQASYEALQTKCNELELENRKLKAEVINKTDTIEHIFRCLIKANYQGKLNDTIFINKFSTLFDYIAGALGIKETDEYVAMVLEDIEDDR